MAFQPSYNSRVLLGGLNLSCEVRSVSIQDMTDMLDTTTLCETAKAYIPGQTSSSFSADGPLDVDSSTNAPYDILTDWKSAAALPLTYAPSGLAALAPVLLGDALQSDFSTTATQTATTDFSVSAQLTGPLDAGFSLEDLAAVTATGNGTARDLTASSTNGGVAHLHVTAFTGLTSNVVTIEDSADGTSGWATIGTFTTVAGITSERLVIAGTVRRYLRVVDTVTGTGSCTRALSFARR